MLTQKKMQQWLEQVVIGFNFCPFAKREFDAGSIRYTILANDKTKYLLEQLLLELKYLDENPEVETSLLIVESGLMDFYQYLDVFDLCQKLLELEGYEGVYQLASFHPLYVFDGCDVDDAANYTNRSPFPAFHLIREESMEKALSTHPNPDDIPERNITLSREKGEAYWKTLLAEISSS